VCPTNIVTSVVGDSLHEYDRKSGAAPTGAKTHAVNMSIVETIVKKEQSLLDMLSSYILHAAADKIGQFMDLQDVQDKTKREETGKRIVSSVPVVRVHGGFIDVSDNSQHR
jgi:hypothetical protein